MIIEQNMLKPSINKPHYFGLKVNLILVFLFILFNLSSAQFQNIIDISSWHDDNINRSPDKVEDIVTNFDLQLGYQPDESNLNLYFNGSYLLYNEFNTRSFYMNALGFNFVKNIDKDELHTFYLGVDWTFRVNNEDFNYYDYHQLYAYNNLSFNLDWFFLRGGYNYRYRNYANIPDLNNHQFYGFMQINKSFETRTTFIMEADFGYKSFAGQNFTTYTGSGTTGGGKGRGSMSEATTTTYTTTTVNEIPSLSQAVLLARIAQSLHTRVGVYAQYRKQISLTDETSYINSDNYYQDEEFLLSQKQSF